jgi:putative effector of murein hydrolase
VPLFRNLAQVRRALWPIGIALLAGSLTAIVSGVGIASLLGADRETLLSLAPKSITTPVAMGVAEEIGGLPSLTAVLVVLTGTFGALVALPLFRLLGVRESAAQGFSLGLTAHGIGTARAFTVDELAGAFAGLAMGLNALVTAIAIPLLLPLLS